MAKNRERKYSANKLWHINCTQVNPVYIYFFWHKKVDLYLYQKAS